MDTNTGAQFDGQVLENPKLNLLADGAQTVDLLGYQPYVDAMVEVLAQKDLHTPFAVGVFGRWGTGKSTFMNLLQQQLSQSERRKRDLSGGFHFVKFQPWQFEDKEEVWKALLLSVIRYLEHVHEERFSPGEEEGERIKQTLRNLALSVGKLAINKAVQSITAGAVDLDAVIEAYAATSKENSDFINTFRKRFGDVKQDILGKHNGDTSRLFVCVDDLDRCTPDNCIMVLEAIKLFFDFEGCVFLLGIDREVVQRGIEQKYRDSVGIHGQDYIDKLIQLPFSLPPIQPKVFETFVNSVTTQFEFSPEIRSLVVLAAENNPRSAKRLSNCLQLTKTVADRLIEVNQLPEMSEGLQHAKLALLLMLQVRYPVCYLWLSLHPMAYETLEVKWNRSTDSEGRVVERGIRADLIKFLRRAYGDQAAEQTADGFFRLWGAAHKGVGGSDAIGVPPFTDPSELQAYMRITGIVNESSAYELAKIKPPGGEELHDEYYLLNDEDAKPPPPPPQPLPSEPQTHVDALLAESAELLTEWKNFENINVIRVTWMLPRLLRLARQNAEELEEIRVSAKEFLSGHLEGKSSDELKTNLLKLQKYSRERALRHISATTRSFAMLWPIAVAILGMVVELFLGLFLLPEDSSNVLYWSAETLLEEFYLKGLYIVINIPDAFPGGPLFFWTSLGYALFSFSVMWRAQSDRQSLVKGASAEPDNPQVSP